MHTRLWLTTALALLSLIGAAIAGWDSSTPPSQEEAWRALDGEWLYVEDRTEGRPKEEQQPPMSAKFTLRVEDDAVYWERPRGDEPMPLDGSTIEVAGANSTNRFSGKWKDGVLESKNDVVKTSDKSRITIIRREFRPTPDGLLVRVSIGEPPQADSLALYRHPNEIPLPTPAEAEIEDIDWLTGAWVGTKGSSSIEERWSPPLGGSMLGVSRTVKNERMSSFEYLRIVERKDGLVYFAQPGGKAPTEFVLTQCDMAIAVFENPRHDFPQRIVYELSDDDILTASIGFIHGGKPTQFKYKREGY